MPIQAKGVLQMKPFFLRNKNLIVTWLFSYILIILVLLFVIVLVGAVYERTIDKANYEFNNYVLNSVTSNVNDTLLDINNCHLNIVGDEKLEEFVSSRNGKYYSTAQFYDIVSDVKKYNRSSVSIDLVFVYLKHNDTVLSEHGVTSAATFYDMHFKNNKMSYETWRKTIINTETDAYQTMFYQNDDGQTTDANAFIFKISTVNSNGVGVIISNKEHFLKGIRKIEWRDLCDIYIYNTSGNLILYEKKTTGEAPRTIEQLKKSTSDKIYYSNIMVNKYAWHIAAVMHKGWIGKMMFITRTAVIGMVLLGLLLLGVIVRYLLKLNYKPVKSIMELFGSREKHNEYEQIYYLINNMIDENKHLVKDKNVHLNKFKHMVISEIIRGTSSETNIEKYGIIFQSNYYCILLFCLEDISELFANEQDVSDRERKEELEFIIGNIFAELFDNIGITVYTVSVDNYIVCLVNPIEKNKKEDISAAAGEGTDFINREFNINLTYVISDVVEGIYNIADAYFWSIDAMENKLLLGISESVCAGENYLTGGKTDNGVLNLYEEQRLIRNVQIGNADAAVMLIGQITDNLKNDERLSVDYVNTAVMHIYFSIINGVKDVAEEHFLTELEVRFYKSVKRDREINSEKICMRLTEDVKLICESIKSDRDSKKSKTQVLIEKIKKHIDENYADPNMNVMSIADKFNMNASYISRQFKEAVNMSMLDYINYLRIKKAVEMSKDGGQPYREIYLKVGYTNERTFYRMLKKFNE